MTPNKILEIHEYIENHYAEKITLDFLAERYQINKFYISRKFKEQFGVSVMDYLLVTRLTHAKEMLQYTTKTAEEIGLEAGIGNIQYFSRVFKKAEGVGIRSYRSSQSGSP